MWAKFQSSATGLDVLPPVFGGATRQGSVRAGLEALAHRRPDIVLIHDAARPFASAALVCRVRSPPPRAAAQRSLRCRSPTRSRASTPKAVSTRRSIAMRCGWCRPPQSFAFPALLAAHRRAAEAGREDFTDDAALAEWAGLKVSVFAGGHVLYFVRAYCSAASVPPRPGPPSTSSIAWACPSAPSNGARTSR